MLKKKYSYQVFYNKNRDEVFHQYSEGPVQPSIIPPTVCEHVCNATVLDIAEVAFRQFNLETRANRNAERSMSVSDVVCVLDNETGEETWLSCEFVGWKAIQKPNICNEELK